MVQLEPVPDIDKAFRQPVWKISPRESMLTWAFWLFVGTIAGTYGMAPFVNDAEWERIEAVMTSVIPVETLIIGAAASYFFKD